MKEYAGPNTLLKAFQIIRQAIKSVSLTTGDGLSKTGDTISVSNPNRGILTQAEYDALTDAQKASGTYFVDDGSAGSIGVGSAGEVYSTEETRIGTWLGKPLYRRAFSINVHIGPESSKYLDGTELYNADKIINIVASVIPSWEPLVITIGGNNYISCGYSKEEKKIRIYSGAGSEFGSIQTVSVFAEYTKTTDEGGSE